MKGQLFNVHTFHNVKCDLIPRFVLIIVNITHNFSLIYLRGYLLPLQLHGRKVCLRIHALQIV
jgi:hypothetical protein